MPRYRLQPDRPTLLWWGLVALTAAYFGAPAALNAAISERSATADPVVLGADGYDWEIPVAGLDCRGSALSLTKSWTCGDTLVHSTIVGGVQDEEVTLGRLVRGTSEAMLYPSEGATVTEHNGVPMLIDGDTVALLYHGPEEDYLGVVVEGPQHGVLDKIFDALDADSQDGPGSNGGAGSDGNKEERA